MEIRRSGYEHGYRFWVDDEIISSYKNMLSCLGDAKNIVVFEIRTNFIRKTILDGDQILDSERFVAIIPEFDDEQSLYIRTSLRLTEYWMSSDVIKKLVHEAFNFAKRMADDPQPAVGRVIPVVVGVDVCTVQLEGESLDAAIERSITSHCLIPIDVWPNSLVRSKGSRVRDHDFQMYLVCLPRTRVEHVYRGLALMEECPICLRAPTVGAQITFLPDCDHAFHNHCLIQWLLKSKSCPMCRCGIHYKKRAK